LEVQWPKRLKKSAKANWKILIQALGTSPLSSLFSDWSKIVLYLSVFAMSASPPAQAYKVRKIGTCARWFIAVAA